jgi:hypothetical protein
MAAENLLQMDKKATDVMIAGKLLLLFAAMVMSRKRIGKVNVSLWCKVIVTEIGSYLCPFRPRWRGLK